MSKTIKKIISILGKHKKLQYSFLKKDFGEISESTLIRNLNKLQKNNKVSKKIEGKNTYYSLTDDVFVNNYFSQLYFERPPKSYNPEFLLNYIPNQTSFLGERYDEIKQYHANGPKLSTYAYQSNIRGIENILIDLSYSSSKLEGNTYSYLDTEVLIKYHEEAEGKTKEETQMVINHKNAIKYIIDNRNDTAYDIKTFCEVHRLLGKGLLLEDDLGVVRNHKVQIGGSSYTPLDNKLQLTNESALFFQKLSQIDNPFEQSLFILVFIPYFQMFLDINKRTSRISANIPLIKNGLATFSFLQMKERDYITAILAIYELNNYTLMRDLFVDNYLLNRERYISAR